MVQTIKIMPIFGIVLTKKSSEILSRDRSTRWLKPMFWSLLWTIFLLITQVVFCLWKKLLHKRKGLVSKYTYIKYKGISIINKVITERIIFNLNLARLFELILARMFPGLSKFYSKIQNLIIWNILISLNFYLLQYKE